MDKYSYGMKAEKIQKLVKKGDYEAAVKIADTIDWEEVHSVRLLTITAAAYENVKDYRSAIELLQLAYEESAVGKRILYKLTGLAIADKDVELAQHYYEMYLQEASDDNGRYLLRYLLAELKREPLDKRIAILETYRKYEFEEEWALRLAQMYDEAGMGDQCVKLCDEIILWFGVGDYVDEAMALKEKYAPLSAQQREHRDNKEYYAQRYQEVVDEYNEREAVEEPEEEEVIEEPEEGPILPEESWPEQIILVEAKDLDEAVPKALEHLSAYYRKNNKPMGKLTRISAERFNQVGFDAAREHTRGKDLLIDDAAALSEELLADIVHSIKYEQSEQLIVLADKPEQLAYLDSRLGEFITRDAYVPQIEVSEVRAEDVLAHISEKVEDELSDGKKEEARPLPEEEVPAQHRPDPLEDEIEQLSFHFVSEEEEQKKDWALAAGAVDTEEPGTEEPKEEKQRGEEQPLRNEKAEAEEKTDVEAREEEQDSPEEMPQEKAEEEAEEPEMSDEACPPAETIANPPAEDKAHAPLEEKIEKEEKEESVSGENHWDFSDFLQDQSAALHATEVKEKQGVGTKEIPLAQIRQSLEHAEEKPVTDEKTTVVSDIKKALAGSENVSLEGTTKVVNKLGTATGSIGAIGMSEEGFVTYAKNYLNSIDCVLDDAGELALQNAAEARKEKGILLTKEEAENMIEEAADLSERKGGLFSRRYNKEGCLILKSKYIQ